MMPTFACLHMGDADLRSDAMTQEMNRAMKPEMKLAMTRTMKPRMARGIALPLLFAAVLASCSETSLNEAPVVDLSAQSRAPLIAPPPMAIPAAPGEAIYTVKKGDTLFHLAANAGATMQDLARWNGIDVRTPLVVGQQLRLQAPGANAETAASSDSAPAAGADSGPGAVSEAVATPVPLGGGYGVETRALDSPPGAVRPLAPIAAAVPVPPGGVVPPYEAAAAVPATTAIAPLPAPKPASPSAAALPPTAPVAADEQASPSAATAAWIWPATGPVVGNFDGTSKGIEIAAIEDTPVVAVADGTVSYVGSPRDYGNLIILKHSDELLSVYAHVKTLLAKEGQTVRRGQTIATAGKAAGVPATLHFEVRRNHVPVDPLGVLPLR